MTGDKTPATITSTDPAAERVEQLRKLFPECFAEGRSDFDKLRAALGDAVAAGPERFTLSSAGRADAAALLQTPVRLKSNPVLDRKIAAWLTRPVGRPLGKPRFVCHSFRYRAGSWDRDRRVVVEIAWHASELFPRVGFVVTNLNWRSRRVIRFSNERGTAEQ